MGCSQSRTKKSIQRIVIFTNQKCDKCGGYKHVANKIITIPAVPAKDAVYDTQLIVRPVVNHFYDEYECNMHETYYDTASQSTKSRAQYSKSISDGNGGFINKYFYKVWRYESTIVYDEKKSLITPNQPSKLEENKICKGDIYNSLLSVIQLNGTTIHLTCENGEIYQAVGGNVFDTKFIEVERASLEPYIMIYYKDGTNLHITV